MNDRVNEYIRAWIGKADNDLKNAELVLAARDVNCPYDTVCFHCQQAVEKYLKALSEILFSPRWVGVSRARGSLMAIHPDFPKSPYSILNPDIR